MNVKKCDVCGEVYGDRHDRLGTVLNPKGRTILVSHAATKHRAAIDLCFGCCQVLDIPESPVAPKADLLDLFRTIFRARTT